MKTAMLTAMIMLTGMLTVPLFADNTTVYRDSSGRTTGTATERRNSDGTTTTTYRDSEGRTTGTETARSNADGSTTTTARDTSGRTVGTKNERK